MVWFGFMCVFVCVLVGVCVCLDACACEDQKSAIGLFLYYSPPNFGMVVVLGFEPRVS